MLFDLVNAHLFQYRGNIFFWHESNMPVDFFAVLIEKNLRRNCPDAESIGLFTVLPVEIGSSDPPVGYMLILLQGEP